MCFLLLFSSCLVLCAVTSDVHPGHAAWRCFCSLVARVCYTNVSPWVSSSLVCTIPTSPVATLISYCIFPYFPAESCGRAMRWWESMEATWGRSLSLQLVFLLTPAVLFPVLEAKWLGSLFLQGLFEEF